MPSKRDERLKKIIVNISGWGEDSQAVKDLLSAIKQECEMDREEILREIDFITPMYYVTFDYVNNQPITRESYKSFREQLADALCGKVKAEPIPCNCKGGNLNWPDCGGSGILGNEPIPNVGLRVPDVPNMSHKSESEVESG